MSWCIVWIVFGLISIYISIIWVIYMNGIFHSYISLEFFKSKLCKNRTALIPSETWASMRLGRNRSYFLWLLSDTCVSVMKVLLISKFIQLFITILWILCISHWRRRGNPSWSIAMINIIYRHIFCTPLPPKMLICSDVNGINEVNILVVGKDDTVVVVGRGDSQPVKMLHSFWVQLQVSWHPRPKWGYGHSTKNTHIH